MSIASFFAFPLFARELTERAARRRTYALRVGYGLLLYTIFVFTIYNLTATAGLGALGMGRELLHRLVDLECWGILLFQPALMAGVITSEKERESFHLLVLAGMRPSKILLEKLAAGLLPNGHLAAARAPARCNHDGLRRRIAAIACVRRLRRACGVARNRGFRSSLFDVVPHHGGSDARILHRGSLRAPCAAFRVLDDVEIRAVERESDRHRSSPMGVGIVAARGVRSDSCFSAGAVCSVSQWYSLHRYCEGVRAAFHRCVRVPDRGSHSADATRRRGSCDGAERRRKK